MSSYPILHASKIGIGIWFRLGQKKYMCVSDCMVFKIRVGRSGFFFFFFETCKYAPASKITHTCLFLSYYSLLIIWHAVQCFRFQTSIKCTRKWRKFRQYRNSPASIVEFGYKHGNGDEFPDFVDLFFFWHTIF